MAHIAVVDASILIYAAFTTVGHFSIQAGPRAGEPTGLRYGFVRNLRSYVSKAGCQKVYVCFDMPGTVLKASEMEDYKANRPVTEEKETMWQQVPALKELISLTSWDQIEAPGYEADDLIGRVSLAALDQGHRVTIFTNDNDLCQLVRADNSCVIQGLDKAKTIRSASWVQSRFGIAPEHLLIYRACAGDVSDNIPAIPDFAKHKNALKGLLSKLQGPLSLEQLTASAQTIPSLYEWLSDPEFRTLIEKSMTVMALNLPPKGFPTVTKGKRDAAALAQLFSELEFKSMMKHVSELTGTV